MVEGAWGGSFGTVNGKQISLGTSQLRIAKQFLPVWRHFSFRSGHRLRSWVRTRWEQFHPPDDFLLFVIVEPVLKRFEACHNGMTAGLGVFFCMLVRRTVTASDVTALGAPTQMEPPSAAGETIDAARTAR